jgi:hypothetical protein
MQARQQIPDPFWREPASEANLDVGDDPAAVMFFTTAAARSSSHSRHGLRSDIFRRINLVGPSFLD